MPIPTSLVGTTFSASDIGIGSTTGISPIVFTETQLLSSVLVGGMAVGPNAVATVTSVGSADPATGMQAVTLTISGSSNPSVNGQTLMGNTVGIDVSDFALTGTLFGMPGTFYITNTPSQQPLAGGTATMSAINVPFTPACYCVGTLIRTNRGDVAVEDLAIGDRVVTVDGSLEPIHWIGTRSYHGRFLAGHDHLLPIRFRAGSLGDNTPTRDLLVSPKHAMLIDGVLVAAELLVNGLTITRETAAKRVDYVHVELASHQVIWAEGAASETFVDDESRGMFHNAATYRSLYPHAVHTTAQYCAPRVTGGFELAAIRRKLNALTGEMALAS